MIFATEMQGTVDNQMSEVMNRAPALRDGFGPDNTVCQNNFRRWMFVCQDIGGFVLAAVPQVKGPHDLVGRQDDRSGHAGGTRRPPDDRSGVGDQSMPGRIRHDDIDG